MSRIIQWKCKGLMARYKEVWFLMNRFQPSCLCLQEVMLDNVKYNLGREYIFYATIQPGQRNKRRTIVEIAKK